MRSHSLRSGVQQFLEFAHLVEVEVESGLQQHDVSNFFGKPHEHVPGESLEEKNDVLPEEKVEEQAAAAFPVQKQAEKVTTGNSTCCSELQKSISSRKAAFKELFPTILAPPAIMIITLVLLFALPKSSDIDDKKCLAPGTDFMMLETLVETCDCVQPELEDAYLNVRGII